VIRSKHTPRQVAAETFIGIDDSKDADREQTTVVEVPPRMAPKLREYEPPNSQPLVHGSVQSDENCAWKQELEEARSIIQRGDPVHGYPSRAGAQQCAVQDLHLTLYLHGYSYKAVSQIAGRAVEQVLHREETERETETERGGGEREYSRHAARPEMKSLSLTKVFSHDAITS